MLKEMLAAAAFRKEAPMLKSSYDESEGLSTLSRTSRA
jgi:hypothetical protein